MPRYAVNLGMRTVNCFALNCWQTEEAQKRTRTHIDSGLMKVESVFKHSPVSTYMPACGNLHIYKADLWHSSGIFQIIYQI